MTDVTITLKAALLYIYQRVYITSFDVNSGNGYSSFVAALQLFQDKFHQQALITSDKNAQHIIQK